MDAIQAAENQFRQSPDDAADRAHVLEKIIGFERGRGENVEHLESLCDALYGHSTASERAAKQRRRAYARAKRAEEMAPFIAAIKDAYPDVTVRLDWSRKHGRKTVLGLAGIQFGPTYISSARYGAGDPDDLLADLPRIVRDLRAQVAAKLAVDNRIGSGEFRRQGGFVVLPANSEHKSFDARFGGIPLSLSYDSIVTTQIAIEEFAANGVFTGVNAYGR